MASWAEGAGGRPFCAFLSPQCHAVPLVEDSWLPLTPGQPTAGPSPNRQTETPQSVSYWYYTGSVLAVCFLRYIMFLGLFTSEVFLGGGWALEWLICSKSEPLIFFLLYIRCSLVTQMYLILVLGGLCSKLLAAQRSLCPYSLIHISSHTEMMERTYGLLVSS